ncbi:hypothetical protein P5673_026426 [Acropora cervicornis]|uniref:Integrase core domain-containing protein n=1 Tax=Acropora cervicornis TaxID=6130 RepID=A0AAD9Q076_ACRCE|nr:hypothetical protein P5673_026426 [Acropora cervicornis]
MPGKTNKSRCQDVEDFLTSMVQCFEDVDDALRDEALLDELKQLVSNLLKFSQGLLQEIHRTMIQRQGSTVRTAAWIPSKEESSRGRPSESTLYGRRQELGLHESFVDIGYEELYTVITGMLNQTPYAGESYVSGGLRACVLRRRAATQRRLYNVRAPNHFWHIDGHHKLVNWRFVVHGCTDGYSRNMKVCDVIKAMRN